MGNGNPFCLLSFSRANGPLSRDNPAILSQILQAVGWYMTTVILGLGLMALVLPKLSALFVVHWLLGFHAQAYQSPVGLFYFV